MNTNTFRTLAISVSILSALAFVPAQIAFAQLPGSTAPGVLGFTLNFDEQGNSLLNGGANPNPVLPIAGGGIQFVLPQLVTPGFVLVQAPHDMDPVKNPAGDTDLLTFFNRFDAANNPYSVMLFESLIDDNDPVVDLADVPFLNYPVPIANIIQESAPEGNNGFQWVPGLATGAIYNGISDGTIPEPSTIVLGSLGLLSLAALAYRRSRLAKAL